MTTTSDIAALNQALSPFRLVDTGKSCSLLLTDLSLNQELFATRAKEGFVGNGYDWQSVASVVLSNADAHLQAAVKFDSESSMFCAYGPLADMSDFGRILKSVVVDPDAFLKALKEAELD